MKIAILGGAFNPVHREHVNLAKAAVKELKLDKIIIMPTAVSPHKSGKLTADFWQRFEMCRYAFSSIPEAEVNAYELSHGGVSYTYLTCEHFANLYPGAKRYFIIGADMLCDFPTWKNPEEILRTFNLAACARENSADFLEYKREVEERFSVTVESISYVGEKVSSTHIRTLAALGEDISGFVNKQVGQYISSNGIYALENLWEVKKMITPERWQHTLRVADMCVENCSRVNLDERSALTMAALHDCAKYLNADSLYLDGFVCPDNTPKPVIHQYAGAYVAEHKFGVTDQKILSAISGHATGKVGMSEIDMLLYLSDMLENGRNFDGVEMLREEFKKSVKGGMIAALEHQLKYLNSTGEKIDGNTLKTYEWLKENYDK